TPIGDPLLCPAKGGQPDCATPLAAGATLNAEDIALSIAAEFDVGGASLESPGALVWLLLLAIGG
ncbi:MAG: hypothetical protein WCC90_00870, partial [Methylocella sp.]